MAKVSFNKLNLEKEKIQETKEIKYNDLTLEVKQYLPMEQKIDLISNVANRVINSSENSFKNPMHVEIFSSLEILSKYTNITFTEKQKEKPLELYDLLEANNIFNLIIENIPEVEYAFIIDSIDEVLKEIYNHKNSALGILEVISQDYKDTNLDASAIMDTLADDEKLSTLKNLIALDQ